MSDDASGAVDRAKELLEGLLDRMDFEATVEAALQGEGEILLQVSSPEAARLIGRGAQMLEAIQYVVSRMALRGVGEGYRVIVDIELYRERRRDRLLKEAYEAAESVRDTGETYAFAPMNAAERRIVHQALRDEPGVETISRGEDERGYKRLVVRPTGEAPAADDADEEGAETASHDDVEPDVDDIIER